MEICLLFLYIIVKYFVYFCHLHAFTIILPLKSVKEKSMSSTIFTDAYSI